ncbi:MAG: class C sortase [Clostridia bacterium]|nr:class C sortase [Clostridia bacterium]
MKKHLSTIIVIVVFVIGLGLMLYPVVSDLLNKAHQSYAISSYDKQVAKMSKEDFHRILTDARSYNKTVTQNEFPRDDRDVKGNDEYLKAINPSGNGMIGYLKIETINVKMPIYHTTKESVLQIGVGHIPTTSLPVGGLNTHAVLTGHRGLPSAKLFTDLDKVKLGDRFQIIVLDDTLNYEVVQIKTVLPTDTADLQIVPGKDYVTLVTCTPYGINTHRLLVRGERVETIEESAEVTSEAVRIDPLTVAPVVLAPVLLAWIILMLTRPVKKKKTKDNKAERGESE